MLLPFRRSPLALAVAAALGASSAGAQTVLVSEFQVNAGSPTGLSQPKVDSASAANGDFVVVWDAFDDPGATGDEAGIRARAHFADGTPFTPVIQANSVTAFTQDDPAVAMNANGDFVVVWVDSDQEAPYGGAGVYGQLFASDGQTVGVEFAVPADPLDIDEIQPQVAMADSGDFIVTWSEGFFADIEARLFSSGLNGFGQPTPLTGDVLISTDTTANREPAIGVGSGAAPRFVIAWTGQGSGDLDGGIYMQQVDAAGALQGPNRVVNTTLTGEQKDPAVAVDSGSFVVAWEATEIGSGAPFDIFAQRFDAGALPLGSEFQVNVTAGGDQNQPSAAMDASGNFAIAWRGPDQNANGVHYQRYDNQGAALFAADAQLNTLTDGPQERVEIDLDGSGELLAAWHGDDGTGNIEIYAQRSSPAGASPPNLVGVVAEAVAEGKAGALSAPALLAAALGVLAGWRRRLRARLPTARREP